MENLSIGGGLLAGTIIALVVQGAKALSIKYVGEKWQNAFTLAFLVVISFLAAGFVQLMVQVGYWSTFVAIGVNAAGIWALLIRRIE